MCFLLEIGDFRRLQLQLELVCNKRNKFGIRGFSLGIADGIAEEALEGIQVTSVPGNLDGMADGSLYPGWGGLEGFCHLGVEHLGDGIGVPYGPPGSFQKKTIYCIVYSFRQTLSIGLLK